MVHRKVCTVSKYVIVMNLTLDFALRVQREHEVTACMAVVGVDARLGTSVK